MSETKKSNLQSGGIPSIKIDAKLSVTPDTTLIYGQQFYFNVILTVNTGNLQAGYSISITAKADSGITIVPPKDAPVTSGHENSIYSGLYTIVIDDYDANTIRNGKVSFTVSLNNGNNNAYNKDFSYNVKKILPYTLELLPDKPVCVIPKKYSDPKFNDPKDTYILYETQLLEDTGDHTQNTPLKKALVYLIASLDEDISKNVIITSDPDQKNTPLIIYTPTSIDGKIFISLTSDDNNGKIRFRVYSNNKSTVGSSDTNYKPTLLSLGCVILGQEEYPHMSEKVCIISPRPFLAFDDLELLLIPAADGGVIYGGPDDPTFEVTIQPYDNPTQDDHILFFTKEKHGIPDINSLILPIYNMQDANEAKYSFPIPFASFKPDEWEGIFYVIARKGNTRYSMGEMIKISGGRADLVPSDGIERTYNKVQVYSSFADYAGDPQLVQPGEENALFWERSYTTRTELSNYIKNGKHDAYVKITATNDPTDDKRPKVGDTVYVNMYVKSGNKNFFHKLPDTKLSATLDTIPASNTTLCSTVIPVKHPLYYGIRSYSDGSPAFVYFEYYTMDKNNKATFSHYWRGMTDTSLPGLDDDDD
ncbi:hypothetical protein [Xenorhabdus griffiniae]|uniref:Uncharacterized protein n=1 Tax=Xenorhabdus griffiniae TaxID=351672 RepID=A0ABY9XCQ9_9GAMM|nr:hypothetical protein [Xenorhabdus griffiniae]MBD1226469.1 hypothetical protein [Xenorhabdus griffiniae]MBE8587134.1 hypothetical protein [Xenorhabdus griffiniae]WMV70695.1 hypothetical protein QL128_10630 [Xenorhabdus griffiniae]WNH00372.1 hypothetical protein QL112_010635 [Xenorhabdus griffiniae]